MTAPEPETDTPWLTYSCALIALCCAINISGFLEALCKFSTAFLVTFMLTYGLATMIVEFVQSYESKRQAFQESLKALDKQDSRRDWERMQRVDSWRNETAPSLTWGASFAADGNLGRPMRKKVKEEKVNKYKNKLRKKLSEVLTSKG